MRGLKFAQVNRNQSMKHLKSYFTVCCLTVLLWVFPPLVSGQNTGMTAEAIGQANLRASADVNSTQIGQIQAGTRYPVIGRSELYPWVLLGDPTTLRPIGWVYKDLVTFDGDINKVPFSQVQLDGQSMTVLPSAAVTNIQPAAQPTLPSASITPTATMQLFGIALPTGTATLSANTIIGLVTGEINIRFGPGVDYPRIGVAEAGERYEIIARHAQLPWLQIRYPAAPNGFGWVAKDLLDIQGDVNNLPTISQMSFALPTLTATPPAVQAISFESATPVPISPAFKALGDQVWNMVLKAGFDPETSKFGAFFLMDLQTGEALSFGSKYAFSGMSLNKIAILSNLYSTMSSPPSPEIALDIANMMVCSENSASNALLTKLGNGDAFNGAQSVTLFMQQLGLGNTYIVAPFLLDPKATPAPVRAPTTQADQVKAQPDYSNQMTVSDLGWLLGGIYQCAYKNSGALINGLPNSFDSRKCHQMIDVMSSNNMGQPLLMSAGVPPEIRVAHKHGWTADTHGNAGIVFTPGGNYVLVVALHNPTWLDFGESFPLITEISRTIYNYYNPNAPMKAAREPYIVTTDECKVAGTPILNELTSLEYKP
jgi:uncharacterized protein YraI